jgi:hypothetical protein
MLVLMRGWLLLLVWLLVLELVWVWDRGVR